MKVPGIFNQIPGIKSERRYWEIGARAWLGLGQVPGSLNQIPGIKSEREYWEIRARAGCGGWGLTL